MSKNTQISDLINFISVNESGNVVLSNGHLVATQNYVSTAVANLVDAAPTTLDTLNELAAALGDDPNFATTLTNSIGGKLSLTGGTLSGALNGTSASFTGAIISTGGWIQFANNFGIEGRNAANTAYRTVLKLNTSNQLEIGRDSDISSIILGTASAVNALTLASTGAATFSSSVTADSLIIANNDARIRNNDATGRIIIGNSSTNTFAIFYGTSHPTQANQTVFANGGLTTCTFSSTGAATFNSSVTATSLTTGTNSGSSVNITTNNNNGTSGSPLQTNVNFYGYNGNLNGQIRVDDIAGTAQVGTMKFYTWNSGQVLALTLAQTGAATFSSSVTATQFIAGGTPSNTAGFTNNFYTESTVPSITLKNTDAGGGKFSIGLSGANFGVWNNTTSSYPILINSSNNVGIGTASPSAILDVRKPTASGDTQFNFVNSQNSSSGNTSITSSIYLGFFDDSNGLAAANKIVSGKSGDYTSAPTANSFLAFHTTAANSTAERMRITSGGYLKASNTGTYADVNGNYHEIRSNQATNAIIISNTNASPYIANFNMSGTPNNDSIHFLYCEDSTAKRINLLSNGGIQNYQANNLNLSDERTKKDIEPLESYWDKFKAIEIVKFKYKDQTHDDFNIGVIAQQVESVAPEFVDVDGWNTKPELDEEGNEIVSTEEPLKSIYTADLYHATIKVLQEAMAKIEKLEKEIDSLKNQIK